MQSTLNSFAAHWRSLNKTQLLRHGVQLLSFLLFPGLFLTVFNALKDVAMALFARNFTVSALSGSLVTLAAVIGVTALWGRFFCGYLCTFGALQELLSAAGRKLLPDMRRMPERADKLLKFVKYGVLLLIVLLVWGLQLPVDSSLSPWGVFGALLSGNAALMGEAIPTLGFGLLLMILIVSLFVERAFCRYLCPLGALFTPVSLGRLFRIRRMESACTGCQQCTRACAMGVIVHEDPFVRSGECIDCMRCQAVCGPQALRTLPHPAVAGTASALALCGLIQVGKLAVSDEPVPVMEASIGEQVVSAEAVPPSAKYVDGVYTGQGNGFRGVISAQVTVSGNRITDVTILSSKDDSDFFQRAQSGIIPAILQAQSVNVSAVSGATYSSRGILEAVAAALQLDTSALPVITETHGRGRGNRSGGQAGEEGSTFGANQPSNKNGADRSGRGKRSGAGQEQPNQNGSSSGTESNRNGNKGQRQGGKNKGQAQNGSSEAAATQPEAPASADASSAPAEASPSKDAAFVEGIYPDGVYTGSGTGYRGATQVQVTVEKGRIADITVLSYADDQQYFSQAKASMVEAILNAQGVDVAAVSGATFSSNGILEAVANALDIDFTNPNAAMGGRRKGRK